MADDIEDFDPAAFNAFKKARSATPIAQSSPAQRGVPAQGDEQIEEFDPTAFAAFKQARQPSIGMDVIRSIGSKVPETLANVVTGPMNLLTQGVGAAANYLAPGSSFSQSMQEGLQQAEANRQAIQRLRQPGVLDYTPQSPAGQTAAQLTPYAAGMVAGPRNLLTRAVTNVALPAIGGETAGALTAGTPYEPYARAGGAIAGGVLGGAVANRAPREVLPTKEQIRANASKLYEHPDIEAVQIRPESVNGIVDKVRNTLESRGYRDTTPEAGKSVFTSIEKLRQDTGTPPSLNVAATMGAGAPVMKPGTPGPPAGIADIQAVRKNLGVMGTERNAQGQPTPNAAAAMVANRELGNHIENLGAGDLLAGNAQRATDLIKQANQDWASQAKLLDVDRLLTKAERQAARSGMGSNIDNAIRQKISSILDSPERSVGYTPEELAQMNRIVNGTPAGNALRIAGKLGPHGALSTMAAVGSAAATKGLSIPFSIGALAARKGAEATTKNAAAELENMIARRSALAQQPQFQTGQQFLPSSSLPGVNLRNPYYQPRPSFLGNVVAPSLLPAYISSQLVPTGRPQVQVPYGAQ